MRRILSSAVALLIAAILLVGCDVPSPPPELPTPTPGSGNPESPNFDLVKTPEVQQPSRGYTPVPAAPGNIFFVRDTGLWRISPDGSGLLQLSRLPISNTPEPSPDGKLVAFTSGSDLYTISAVGGDPKKLATSTLADYQRLGWSGDGKYIGFMTVDTQQMGVEQAWAVPAAGGQPQLITSLTTGAVPMGPVYQREVQWSNDDKWVLVASVDNPFRLLRWPLSTGNAGDTLDIPGGEPTWSPDSRYLIYAETLDGALLTYNVLAAEATPFRNERRYVGTGLGQYAEGPGPRFSPVGVGVDSDLITYRSHTSSGEPQIAIRPRTGPDLTPLPPLTDNAAWSPGGDRLVVETGILKQDTLGTKWQPTGLAIAKLNFIPGKSHIIVSLVKDGKWPAWGK